jgi:hypothetical protein
MQIQKACTLRVNPPNKKADTVNLMPRFGHDNVLARLRDGVNGLDRRFDARAGDRTSTQRSDNVVTITWKMTLSKRGLPDLTLSGREHATFSGDAICRLEDMLDPGAGEVMDRYMAEYGARLNSCESRIAGGSVMHLRNSY